MSWEWGPGRISVKQKNWGWSGALGLNCTISQKEQNLREVVEHRG